MNTEAFKPLGSRVLVKRLPMEEKIGMFYLPEAGQELSQRAEVLALGTGGLDPDGKPFDHFEVAVGDIVLIGKYNGTPTGPEKDAPLVLFQREILGILED